jgi:hypothetical protein
MYKKKIIALLLSFILFTLFYGCEKNTKIIFVVSRAHENNFECEIDDVISYQGSTINRIEVKLGVEEFFAILEQDNRFIERFNSFTGLFLQQNESGSSYFVVKYNGGDYFHKYDFMAADIRFNYPNDYFYIDFPFYVLLYKESQFYNQSVYEITCDFDYIKEFYQRINYVIEEQGEDYIVVTSYKREYITNEENILETVVTYGRVKIQYEGDNLIRVTNVTEDD